MTGIAQQEERIMTLIASKAAQTAAARKQLPVAAANDVTPAPQFDNGQFRSKIFFEAISGGFTPAGDPIYNMEGCSMTLAGGTEATRSVVAVGEAQDLVRQVVEAGQDLDVVMMPLGHVMKITGIVVDGELRMLGAQLPKAA